jgi:CRISPR-associated protein Cas1
LEYKPLEGETVAVPLEDIAAVILETHQADITSHLIAEMAEHGIALFSCDATHIPSGLFLPFHQHSRFCETAWLQQECSEPFKKRIWQKIVKAKIANQSAALKLCKRQNSKTLDAIEAKVQSGDPGNCEAHAARVYWENLFDNFSRDSADIRNSALNYGYAILRGAVARAIAGAGLVPCFGVHHANQLNAFNLADDLIEPFRPFVDIKTFAMHDGGTLKGEKLSLEERANLVQLLSQDCLFGGERVNLLTACDKIVAALVSAMKTKNPEQLLLPEILIPT